MLTPSIMYLALTVAPGPIVTPPPHGLLLQPQPFAASLRRSGQDTVSIGCSKPKCRARKTINKQLSNLAGNPVCLVNSSCIAWLQTQSEKGRGAIDSGGRDVGATATLALVMLGTGCSVTGGVGRDTLRQCLEVLQEWQDGESGAIGDPERDEYLLDQALAVLALSEAYYSDELPAREQSASRAARALLAGRGEDGLWHVVDPNDDGQDGDDAAVDPLVTSLAGYALFAARDAGIELPNEPFERVLAWTATVAEKAQGAAEGEELGREEALLYAGALCARLFCAQALQYPLAKDEALEHLASAVAAQVPPPPSAGEEWSTPARLAEADFAFFASLGLDQADHKAWGRCSRWFAAMMLEEVEQSEQLVQPEQSGRQALPVKLGSFPEGYTGRLPGGRLGTTALRVLGMQSGVREPSLSVLVESASGK